MHTLYCEHFGLVGEPFNNTPDVQFLYRSPSHREALAQLIYGVNARKGFVVLTGEVGAGKTLLIRTLMHELHTTTKTALIFNSVVNSNDLLRYVCEELELVTVHQEKKENHDYLVLLNQFLLECYTKGENVALIIDEAQNLPAEVLESIRLLSNFETPQDKLLQIILVGQPELIARLNSPALRQLKQRVVLRHHLKPLNLAECREYVAKRLELVGGTSSLFHPDAIESIYLYSGGTPRLINILGDNGLLTAYALRQKRVEARMIREVARDLQLTVSVRYSPSTEKESAPSEGAGELRGLAKPNGEQSFAVIASKSKATNIRPESPSKPALSRQESENKIPTGIEVASPIVPSGFFDQMVHALTEAMGPMAPLVVREQLTALDHSSLNVPQGRLEKLVELVSSEILDDLLKTRFQEKMASVIGTLKRGNSHSTVVVK
jgi:type II secretory pathway predicted ATPase ExeA